MNVKVAQQVLLLLVINRDAACDIAPFIQGETLVGISPGFPHHLEQFSRPSGLKSFQSCCGVHGQMLPSLFGRLGSSRRLPMPSTRTTQRDEKNCRPSEVPDFSFHRTTFLNRCPSSYRVMELFGWDTCAMYDPSIASKASIVAPELPDPRGWSNRP